MKIENYNRVVILVKEIRDRQKMIDDIKEEVDSNKGQDFNIRIVNRYAVTVPARYRDTICQEFIHRVLEELRMEIAALTIELEQL